MRMVSRRARLLTLSALVTLLPVTDVVSGTPDATPPVLADLSFTPASIDTSGSSDQIAFTLGVTDDLSGFETGSLHTLSPSGSQATGRGFHPSDRVSGDALDGTYLVTETFPAFSEAGTWRISLVTLTDDAGNTRNLDTAALAAAGFPTEFDVVSASTPPSAVVGRLPRWSLGETVHVSWQGTAGSKPIATFDVRVRVSPAQGAAGPRAPWLTETAQTSGDHPLAPGFTYCFSARARDTDGIVSPWSAQRCTASPVDDRTLARSGPWTELAGGGFYRDTALRARQHGASLEVTGAVVRRIALVARTCPSCGSVKVFWGTRLLREVDLDAALRRRTIRVAAFPKPRQGAVRVVVVSRAGSVVIDAIGLSRS